MSGGTASLLHFLTSYKFPDEGNVIGAGQLPSEPLTFDIKVNARGVPCWVKPTSDKNPALERVLVDAVLRWRFAPPSYEGHRMCMKSQVYFYVEQKGNHIVFTVPYLTDRPNDPPPTGMSKVGQGWMANADSPETPTR